MFSDTSPAVSNGPSGVEFKSSERMKRQTTESGSQTSQIITDEVGIQSYSKVDVECQTEETIDEEIVGYDDSEELAQFLIRVEEDVTAQLKQNEKTRAFDDYKVQWEDEIGAISCVHTLQNQSLTSGAAPANDEGGLVACQVAWNTSGTAVIVGYGKNNVESFCGEKGYLCIWSINLTSLNPTKPDSTIEIPSYPTSIAAHPSEPSLFAVGTLNGQVCLIDTAKQQGEQIVALSSMDGNSHTEPVNAVLWQAKSSVDLGKNYTLTTVGGDGKLLVWSSMKRNQPALELKSRFLVRYSDLSRHSKRGNKAAGTNVELGLTCASFSSEDEHTLIAGTDTGSIVRCSLIAAGGGLFGEPQSPVSFSYTSHKGPVYAVSFSPFHRNIFLSASTDGSLRIYSLLEAAPVHVFETDAGYLFDAAWSISRPLVLFGSTSKGQILVYDIWESRTRPIAILEDENSKAAVFKIARNNASKHFICSGDDLGRAKVWSLTTGITSMIPNETDMLSSILSTDEN